LGEDLDLVFGGAGAVAAAGAFGGVVFRGAGGDKFGRFDGGEELAGVQGGSVDSAVAASAQEGVGGEAVGGGDDVGVGKVSDWCCGEGFVVGVAGGD